MREKIFTWIFCLILFTASGPWLEVISNDRKSSLIVVSSASSVLNKSRFSWKTFNSWFNSGTTNIVLQAFCFFDLMISPKIWSPTYSTSLPVEPINFDRTSQEPRRQWMWQCEGVRFHSYHHCRLRSAVILRRRNPISYYLCSDR